MQTRRRWDAIAERLPRKKILFAEIGVWQGKTSEQLLKKLPLLELILVDRWTVTPAGDSYFDGSRVMSRHDQKTFDKAFADTISRIAPYKDRVTIYKMNSLEAVTHIEDESLDGIFWDGDHSFKGLTADLKAWTPKVKKGGLMSGHDIYNTNTYNEVDKALKAYLGERFEEIELDCNTTWFLKK